MKQQTVNMIKTAAVNVLATTALSVLAMCLAGIISGYKLWGVTVPFEMLLVNLLIHTGVFFLEKAGVKCRIIHYAAILAYSLGLIIGFGFLFGWFAAFQIWIICLVGAVVVALAAAIDIMKIHRDAAEINEKLSKLRERGRDETPEGAAE